jgi:predicted anti-sigma-YlaC factor YlaD
MSMRCQKARKSVSLATDGRLAASVRGELQEHLLACPSCREWQGEQEWLRGLLGNTAEPGLSPGFQSGLMQRIAGSAAPATRVMPLFARPALLRAAAMVLFVVSALLGMFLGGRLDNAPPASAAAAAVSQALNLEAFADRPVDSFGAVYERLLQGELR